MKIAAILHGNFTSLTPKYIWERYIRRNYKKYPKRYYRKGFLGLTDYARQPLTEAELDASRLGSKRKSK